MFMVMKVAATMVSGWSVFGLVHKDDPKQTRAAALEPARAPSQALTGTTARERAVQSTPAPTREIRLAAIPSAANDTWGSSTGARRETRIVSGQPVTSATPGASPLSRARGIGSRFKSAPIRSTEKM